jgi:hypothetical protein
MEAFEFHFNPKLKEDLIFDSFCFEPENIYEKRLGSLFIVGELKNALPQNLKFLENLAVFLKKKYYSAPYKFSPEVSLKESLKKLNEFLEGIAKTGDVSWLGNLSLAVLSLKPPTTFGQKWWGVNFTKVGSLKIFLLRRGKIIDIDQKLRFQEIEPYPLKIFGNIISSKLVENDIILVLTKEAFELLENQGLLIEIAKLTPFDQKNLKEIFNKKREELLKITGVCLLISLTKEYHPTATFLFKRGAAKEFSFKLVFGPIVQFFKKVIQKSRPIGLGWQAKFLKFPKIKFPKLTIPKIKVSKINPVRCLLSNGVKISPTLKKNLILILIFIIFLTLGFFIFKGEKEESLRIARQVLEEANSKKIQAENFLILKKEKEANILLQEAWNKILPQTKIGAPLRNEAQSLKKSIEENLFSLNKIEKIEEPEILFEFKPKEIEFIPQKILAFNSTLYFYNPFSSNLYQLEIKNGGQLLKTKSNLKLGTVSSDSVLFFSNPNILISLRDGKFQEKILPLPSADFSFDKISSFRSNIYFLDTQSGEIVKYSEPLTKEAADFQFWLNPKSKKPIEARSMAIDGSLWVLTKNNEIERYYGGFYKKTLKPDLFPYLENPTKIFTSETLSYLYLLEPSQNRLIVLTKEGEIVHQFQSEKFDNLLDFGVSKDGKTIYLLNGPKVYQLRTTNY